ncbi:PrpF protein [Neobacillus pocheonensis]|uniref:PrpF protein n=1 Tax=Neobacillus pocheonensis TaxID=363869 RepID=A0ABT0WF46_9BACI|nr:PrpF protein [Neobacillus pocheonensis]
MFDYGQLHKIPTVIMRGGTSKGLILRRSDLPADPVLRDGVILRIFGSPDNSQIDGLGGGTSTTSKLAIVGPSSNPNTHINYTFGQVSLDRKVVDYNVTCGNFVTAVGLYAVEEGYVPLTEPVTSVNIYNTNTNMMIVADIPVKNGQILYEGDFSIAGVPGTASRIMLNFLNAGGTFTGKTLPSNNAIDVIKLDNGKEYEVSIVDCVNTLVFVRADDVGQTGTELPNEVNGNTELLDTLEKIRVKAGIKIGLIKEDEQVSPSTHALPKIVMVSDPKAYQTVDQQLVKREDIDILSRYISMGSLHRAHAVSGAMGLAAAAKITGTIPNQIVTHTQEGIRVGHPSGTLYVAASVEKSSEEWSVSRAGNGGQQED